MSKKKNKNRIKFSLADLQKYCQMPMEDFGELGEVRTGEGGQHLFIDHDANVLAVAHLDTVQQTKHFHVVQERDKYSGKEKLYAMSGQLDDRLGAYIILDLLPRFGLSYDVLLTDNEEFCNSTARDFTPSRQYNWVFEFDRRNSGVVLYQYEDRETTSLLKRYGFDVQQGTYSDIADLEHLGCKCFNFGNGMQDEHSALCYMIVDDCVANLCRFLTFYKQQANTYLPHEDDPKYHHVYTRYLTPRKGFDRYYCYMCGRSEIPEREFDLTEEICADCLAWMSSKEGRELLHNANPGNEGKYQCPRCHTRCEGGEIDWVNGNCRWCNGTRNEGR